MLDQKPLTLNLVTILCTLCICKLSERAGQENIWLEDIMYREGTMRSMCHEWDPNIFPPGLTNSVNRHFIIWLTFEKFKKFVLTWTGHDRLACMGKPKKIFYKKNFPLFCCVRTRNSQFVEKHVLVSHFCALLSLIFCNKSEQCFSFFATKPYK